MPTSMPALSLSPMSMAAMGGYQTAAHAQTVSHATTLSPSSMVTAQALTAQAQAQAQLLLHQQQQQQQQQQSVTSGTTAGAVGVGVGMGAHPAYASATPGTDVAAASATTAAPQTKKRARDAESDLLHLVLLARSLCLYRLRRHFKHRILMDTHSLTHSLIISLTEKYHSYRPRKP